MKPPPTPLTPNEHALVAKYAAFASKIDTRKFERRGLRDREDLQAVALVALIETIIELRGDPVLADDDRLRGIIVTRVRRAMFNERCRMSGGYAIPSKILSEAIRGTDAISEHTRRMLLNARQIGLQGRRKTHRNHRLKHSLEGDADQSPIAKTYVEPAADEIVEAALVETLNLVQDALHAVAIEYEGRDGIIARLVITQRLWAEIDSQGAIARAAGTNRQRVPYIERTLLQRTRRLVETREVRPLRFGMLHAALSVGGRSSLPAVMLAGRRFYDPASILNRSEIETASGCSVADLVKLEVEIIHRAALAAAEVAA